MEPLKTGNILNISVINISGGGKGFKTAATSAIDVDNAIVIKCDSNVAIDAEIAEDPYDIASVTSGGKVAITDKKSLIDARIRAKNTLVHFADDLSALRETHVPKTGENYSTMIRQIDDAFTTTDYAPADYKTAFAGKLKAIMEKAPDNWAAIFKRLSNSIGVDVSKREIAAIYVAYMYSTSKVKEFFGAAGAPKASTNYNDAIKSIETFLKATSDIRTPPTQIAAQASLGNHPLHKYFGNTNGVDNVDDHGLRFIDPTLDGSNRIRLHAINEAGTRTLRHIGYARNNTILTRLVIFMMNAYRVILYRLREDAKVRTGSIASRPEEILDDGMVEFSGFDMME